MRYELIFYDEIGEGGIETKNVRASLNYLKKIEDIDTLLVRFISGGGNVLEANGIVAAFNDYKRATGNKIEVVYDLYGASAAVNIGVAIADRVYMQKDALLLIHHHGVVTWVNSRNAEELAKITEESTKPTIELFVAKTGKTEDEVVARMDEERWMTASEALDFGIIDGIYEGDPIKEEQLNIYALKVKGSQSQSNITTGMAAISKHSTELLSTKVAQIKANSLLAKLK